MGLARLWSERLLFRDLLPRSSTKARLAAPTLRRFFTFTPSLPTTPAPLAKTTFQLCRPRQSPFFRRFRTLRYNSNKSPSPQRPDPTPSLGSPEPQLSVSQRLRKLSREYGWAAVGVYLALSALDFPFCFLAVRYVGVDRIGHYEHVVVEAVKDVLRIPFPNLGKHKEGAMAPAGNDAEATTRDDDKAGQLDATNSQNQGASASIWTQLTVAYVIHKSFIFIRVPVTAAVLPKVVRTLRKWGWNIGKRKPKSG